MVGIYMIYLAFGCPTSRAAPGPTNAAGIPPFRVQLFTEPTTLDPVLNRGASGNYLYHALYRGLFTYRGDRGLEPAGAKRCRRDFRRLSCTLNPDSKWSDGTVITAERYVAAFRRVIDPAVGSPHADLLFALTNARQIHAGARPPGRLGIAAPDPRTVVFTFAEDDFEFEYKLIHPALSPDPPSGFPMVTRAPTLLSSGAYRVIEWSAGGRARLGANPHRPGATSRPPVEMVFVDEDATALNLFESGRLSFLRRLIASEIPRFKARPEFHQVPQARFDYVGFGPALDDRPALRDALTKSVDYPQFLKMFDTRTPPGCISLPARYLRRTACLEFRPDELSLAKGAVAPGDKPPEFFFSRLGGDDIHRAAEWFAAQWKRNLGLTVDLHSEEQSVYLARLRARAPALFRKGAGLDRPTCLAAVEMFEPGNPENYLRLNDGPFNQTLKELRRARTDERRRELCGRAVTRLLNTRRLIPLGEMLFTLLVDPRFSNWDLSEINQLDLSRLEYH